MNSHVEISIGYGFDFGTASTMYERVRKARKSYECEGCLIDSDAAPADTELSPGTGDMLMMGECEDCSKKINHGDLYVALELTGEHAQDFGGSYRHTHRTCINCAIYFGTVVSKLARELS